MKDKYEKFLEVEKSNMQFSEEEYVEFLEMDDSENEYTEDEEERLELDERFDG